MSGIAVGVVILLALQACWRKPQQAAVERLKGTPVVATRVDIPAKTEITLDMLCTKPVEPNSISRQAFRGGEINQLVGRKTDVAIPKDELVLCSDLARESHGGFATVIPPGQVAYAVSISKGLQPGLVQPGDLIDVFGSFPVPKGNEPEPPAARAASRSGSERVNVVLLQNANVLEAGETGSGSGRGEAAGGTVLTLSLTPPEAQMLMFASQQGELGAVLCRHEAMELTERSKLPRVTFQKIEDLIAPGATSTMTSTAVTAVAVPRMANTNATPQDH